MCSNGVSFAWQWVNGRVITVPGSPGEPSACVLMHGRLSSCDCGPAILTEE